MTCATIQKSLSAYLDREVPVWEKENIVRHLDTCSPCQQVQHDLLNIKQSLRTHPMPSMPAAVRDYIEQETIFKPSPWTSWVATRWWIPALTFAAGVGVWALMHNTKVSPMPPVQEMAWHRDAASPKDRPQ